jgi:nucleotide sugar dehydrogenase
VNIALIHEWALFAERAGVDLFAVVDSIRVRKGTHDNMRYPGFGVGGYCLPKDSLLAQWSCTELFQSDVVLEMTLRGLQINDRMPLHTYELLAELAHGDLAGKTVVVCGVSYLPEVADTRYSPTEVLVDELVKAGARVVVNDPYVTRWPERPEVEVEADLAECFARADGVVLAVPHRAYRELRPEAILASAAAPPLVVDAQNVLSDSKAEVLHRAGCRILGVGKGHWRKRGYQC